MAFEIVASALVSFHIAPDAESLAATGMGTLERLLSCVRVAMYAQGTGPRESLAARLADIPVLRLRE